MSDRYYRYGIIGPGRKYGTEGSTGFGMAHSHVTAFYKFHGIELVSIAEVREDNARMFTEQYNPYAKVYTDYREMLANERLDIVSVCTWPALHADMVVAACEAGVKAIHCEKPMATTWGDAKRMKSAADARHVILTFNHQRRFLECFQCAKHLIAEGAIGNLRWLEAECGDMSDWGTHWLDMMFFLNNETPAEWVMGQIESHTGRTGFGVPQEDQAVCHFQWKNGVRGLLIAGPGSQIGTAFRVIGKDGTLEISWEMKSVRIRAKGDADWREIPTNEGVQGDFSIDRACADLVRGLDEPGYKPMLTVDHAIQHTEVIFATFESSRRRGRVTLPLTEDDNALLALLAAGEIGPSKNA